MKIKVLSIGKSQPEFIKDGISIYIKKIQPMCQLEWVELQSKKKAKDKIQTQRIEEELLLKHIEKGDRVILLDEQGKIAKSSRDFAQMVEQWGVQGYKSIVLVIGGAFGFSDTIYHRADNKISMSPMTFSHQMIRLILLEQLYRAFSIINGLPYHND